MSILHHRTTYTLPDARKIHWNTWKMGQALAAVAPKDEKVHSTYKDTDTVWSAHIHPLETLDVWAWCDLSEKCETKNEADWI